MLKEDVVNDVKKSFDRSNKEANGLLSAGKKLKNDQVNER